MSKGLEALERLKMFPIYQEIKRIPQQFRDKESINTDLSIIEKELKQAEKDKEMLDIFKNAITIEREIPPELEIKESEKGSSYVFKEAVKIHENRIEEMLKKSLREWVLKNAFPKELKALEILKAFDFKFEDYTEDENGSIKVSYTRIILDDDEIDLLKEVLKK